MKKLLHVLGMIGKYYLYGFVVQLFFLNLMHAAPTKGQSSLDLKEVFLSLDLQGVTLSESFSAIKNQTDFSFIYDQGLVDNAPPVNLQVQNQSLESVLLSLAASHQLSFKQVDNRISVKVAKRNIPEKALVVEVTVSGTVVDNNGEPIPGVTVSVPGTTIGTATDLDGKYSLLIPQGSTLVFSFIGFETQTIEAGDQSVIDITLNEDMASLDEVVVVGYGEQSKVRVTGSVSSVKSKDIELIRAPDLISGLAGRLPGLRVKQNSSEPGSFSSSFDIRGYGDPLIIVDGMVMENRDFSRMNPTTIESISILKDASAAVFGVKAANGVVLVETKKGELGKPTVSYSGNYGLVEFTQTPEPMTAYQFAVFSTEIELNQGRGPNETTFRSEDLLNFQEGTRTGTNWYDLVTREYSTQQTHNVNVSGGSDKIRYFTSFGYVDDDGMWKSGDLNYKKYNLNANVIGQISDNLEMQLNINGMMDHKNEPGAPAFIPGGIGGIYFSLFMQDPTVPIYANNTEPYYSDTYDGQHPYAITNADIGGYRKTNSRTFQGTYTLNYEVPFINGLSATARYGYYNLESYQKTWKPIYRMYRYEELSDTYINSATKNDPINLTGDYITLQRSNLMGQFNYETSILDMHNINATLIYEERMEKNDNLWAKSEFDANVDQFFAGTNNQQVTSNNIYETRTRSIISRMTYDYSLKYLVEAGFNYGGSSLFPKQTRWGFFPYVSAGWNVSQEEFFKNSVPIITTFKLRGSWGQMGDDGAAAFQFLQGYNYPSGNYIFGGQVVPGLGFKGLPNPNITWSTVTSKNIGFELGLERGLINFEFDLFQRDRAGLLATRALTLPGTVGVNLPQENLNEDMTRGFELVLGHSNNVGDFDYFISSNLTYTQTQATHVERSTDHNSYLNWRNNTNNRNINISWGYEVLGQFQNYEEILNSPLQGDLNQGNRFLYPGDIKYRDINNDGIINDMDVVPIGKGIVPQINFGLSGGLNYRQFDLNFLFQGGAGYNYVNGFWYDQGLLWLGRNGLDKFYDRWHRENLYDLDSEWIPGRFPSAYSGGNGRGNRAPSEFWVSDAKYLRLKNLEIGYTVNSSLLSKAGINNIRFYLSGTNLLTFTGLKDVDPERGDQLTYPITRMYNFGINVQF